VTEIREALGDRARGAHIVRTVHRYGYAFAADIEDEGLRDTVANTPARPTCWLTWRKRVFGLTEGEHIAGREPDVGVWLDSSKVSRRHARLVVSGTRATIEDLGSKNGTFVRGARISAPATLEAGDDIRIGPFTLIFRVARGPVSTETQTLLS
jgi:hypothetical protein